MLKAWAQELGIGMVATNDGHYVKKTDATAHETLLAIQTGNDPNLPPLMNPAMLEASDDLTNLSHLNEPAGMP